jgi:hypothetical protein
VCVVREGWEQAGCPTRHVRAGPPTLLERQTSRRYLSRREPLRDQSESESFFLDMPLSCGARTEVTCVSPCADLNRK